MESTPDEEQWVEHMFQVTKPRIIDACNLVGLERHRERGGLLLLTITSLPTYITTNGLDAAIRWVIDRHPREVALFILFSIICNAIPHDFPETSNWMYTTIFEIFRWLTAFGIQPSSISKSLTVGVIPDGNRRWGRSRGIGPDNGHFFGSARVMECIRSSVVDKRIGHLIVYVLTYDNIQKRSPKEQRCLMAILRGWVKELLWLSQSGLAHIQVCGEPTEGVLRCLEGIPINPEIQHPVRETGSDGPLLVTLLVGYDGRREIQHAKGEPDKLWVRDELDGVIRTGGTNRASGFCTYQTGYSEWVFTDIMWPDMTPSRFHEYVTKIEESVGLQNHGK
jgi:undecaprenyl diphosphate synthase